jgi:hypothetical protein
MFGGFSDSPQTAYGYVGGLYSFNQNLWQDGWVVRIAGGDGEYSYNSVPGLKRTVGFQNGDMSLGYRTYLGSVQITGYLGGYAENDANGDPFAAIKGTNAGIKGQGEIYAPLGASAYFYALGTMTSVLSNYLLLGKFGYRTADTVSFGPEIMAVGNEVFSGVRAGPFLSFALTRQTELVVSGGYNWDTRRNGVNDNSGGYATIFVLSSF